MIREKILEQLERIPKIQILNGPQKNDLVNYLDRECGGNPAKFKKFVDNAAEMEWHEAPTVAAFRTIAAQLFYSAEAHSRGCPACNYLGRIIIAGRNGYTGAAACPCRGQAKQESAPTTTVKVKCASCFEKGTIEVDGLHHWCSCAQAQRMFSETPNWLKALNTFRNKKPEIKVELESEIERLKAIQDSQRTMAGVAE